MGSVEKEVPVFKRPQPHIFWLRNEKNRPVACVASIRYNSGDLKFAVATHNPHDKFDRTLGRNKAIGRLFAVKETKVDNGKLVFNTNVKRLTLSKDDNPKAMVLFEIANNKHYGISANLAAAYQLGKLQNA